LTRLLLAATEVSEAAIPALFEVYSFGGMGIREPDCMIQPLVRVGGTTFITSAFLLSSIAFERALAVVINHQTPSHPLRQAYDRAKNEKERIMLRRLTDLFGPAVATRSLIRLGAEPLGDLDFVATDIQTRTAILAELKWFIAPAEIREYVHRDQEIATGIRQLRRLLDTEGRLRPDVAALLGLTADWTVLCLVIAGSNFIGTRAVQDSEVAVISESHLAHYWRKHKSLHTIVTLLRARDHIPRLGIDFARTSTKNRFERWTVVYPAFQVLGTNRYSDVERRP